ncbi:hypothetical protein F4824DRAFT_506637 [Ustulina deusta]|nr:hypothetical protein F4824DRAFT_506637 [Ustulina deusta]
MPRRVDGSVSPNTVHKWGQHTLVKRRPGGYEMRAVEPVGLPHRHDDDLDDQVSTSVASLLGFLRGLFWIAPREDAIRRPGFPSWPWTGWKCPGGSVNFHQLNFPIYCSLSRFYAHCDDRAIKDPIEYDCQTEVAKQYGVEMSLSIPPRPGAL